VDFILYVKRTSGPGMSGGESYQVVRTIDDSFFTGGNTNNKDADIQYKLEGMGVQVPPDTYSTVITYSISGDGGSGSDTQTVTFSVQGIDELSVAGNPGHMLVNSASAGQEPDAVQDSSTTYGISTNGSNRKITGELDSAMPAGTALQVNLSAPSGASSQGNSTLSPAPVDLVTGISSVSQDNLTITYTFSALVQAGVLGSGSRTVTLTLTSF
jgi:hypothetical protein